MKTVRMLDMREDIMGLSTHIFAISQKWAIISTMWWTVT